MAALVSEELSKIESELDVSIVGVWEVGSRAFNCANADSDVDVNIVFTNPVESYVFDTDYVRGFDSEQLTSEFEEIEPHGWDVRRFRELLFDGDLSVYETLNSPNPIYAPQPFKRVSLHVTSRFNPIKLFSSYQSAAENTFQERVVDGVIQKKFLFMTIRFLLFGEYVRYTHNFPPMDVEQLIGESPEEVFTYVSKEEAVSLLEAKRSAEQSKEMVDVRQWEGITEFFNEDLEYNTHIPEKGIDKEFVTEQLSMVV